MTPVKEGVEARSPSTSSTFLPLALRSRRSSLSSITSHSQVDRETLNSALDQIHSSASRSAALTTFNDFAPPPSSPYGSDSKSLSGQISQHGLSGVYSRLKSSVTGGKPASTASNLSKELSNKSPLANDSPKDATTKSLGSSATSVSAKASPAKSPQVQSPSSATFAGASLSGDSISKDRGGESTVLSARSSIAEDKQSAAGEKTATPRADSRGQEHTASTGPDAGTAVARSTPIPKSPSDSALEQRRLTSRQSPSPPPKSTMPTPLDLALGGASKANPTNVVSDNGSATANAAHHSSGQRRLGGNRESSRSRKAQMELPGFRLSRNTTPDATDSQSSRTTSVAPSVQLSRANATSDSGAERPKRQLRDNLLAQEMRRKILSRDFWMKDENAKVCFNCGEGFTTFRRKHHCRLCGQIYCNSCTNLISGKPFGQASKLRVCKTCESMLYEDDSSDYSEDDEFSASPQTKHLRFYGVDDDSGGLDERREANVGHDPELAHGLPRTSSFRKERELKRRALAGGNFDRPPVLARPSSSRSLKSMSGRPRSSSQKRRRPRYQHMRSLGVVETGGAPFHGESHGDASAVSDFPAFHKDSIIDPDLAPFMSDEGSSEDEVPTIAGNLSADVSENAGVGLNGLLGALQKGRPRTPAKTTDGGFANLETDNLSITSSRTGHGRRPLSVRPMSVGGLVRYNNSPRLMRSDNLFTTDDRLAGLSFPERQSPESAANSGALSWSSERKQDDAYAGIGRASLEHIKRLLRQFLRDNNISKEKAWIKALVPILLRCAGEVDPNIHRGDAIDIRHYVKLKKAPGGSPKDTSYVSGVVFTKNVALKSMKRTIRCPRILLISFPIIYARHQQHFMSLDPVIAQEREYLRNLVKRIVALRPNVVLLQKSVSGIALQYLNESGVTVAYNVKESVMQALARCTQTRIVSSVERLTMEPGSLGFCESFGVKTFLDRGDKKTYISVSGCQPDLGCTIVLRGAEETTLKRLKWITEFMCYVAYNARLETYLIRDQFVSVPASVTDTPESQSKETDSGSFQDVIKQDSKPEDEAEQQKDVRARGSFHTMVTELQTRAISVSPFVNFPEPYLVIRGRDQEEQMESLRKLRESQASDLGNTDDNPKDSSAQKFELVRPEMIYTAAKNASSQVREILHAIHSAEYDKAAHSYATLKRRWETYVQGASEPFNPLHHQKVIVLFSIVSTPTSDACEGPDLLGLDYYQEHDIDGNLEPDVPLGEYIERLCNQAQSPCPTSRCDKTMLEHHRQYVHGDGQISIFLQKYPSRLKRMENTILMWSSCRICDQETQVVPMSSNTWKYSFGKYLELSFWSRPMHPRADLCAHDIYRDHIRFFGFKNLVVKVEYDPINLVEVIVPRGTITWKVEKDLRLKNEIFQKAEERLGRFMSSVKLRIKSINLDNVKEEKVEACRTEIDTLLKRVNEEYEALTKKLREKYVNSKYYEIIPLNRAARFMQEKVAEWDATFADFERNYFPSEKDIQQLAALQFKQAYLDQEEPGFEEFEDGKQVPLVEIDGSEENGRDIHHSATDAEKESQEHNQTPKAKDFFAGLASAMSAAQATLVNPLTDEDQCVTTDVDQPSTHVVQSLDLAVPFGSPSSPNAHVGSPAKGNAIGAALSPTRHGTSPTHGPAPLHPEVAAKVDEMQNETKHGDVEPRYNAAGGALPIPSAAARRRAAVAPPLFRTQSQPPNAIHSKDDLMSTVTSQIPLRAQRATIPATEIPPPDGAEQSAAELPAPTPPKVAKSSMRSMIPRVIGYKSNDSRVTALAKHFEQMSKEFERERLRERKQRAARWSQARAYPTAASKPVVVVYRDANEAVRERETSHEEHRSVATEEEGNREALQDPPVDKHALLEPELRLSSDVDREVSTATDVAQHEDNGGTSSYPASDADGLLSDSEHATQSSPKKRIDDANDGHVPSPPESLNELPLDIPKHERSSLMKMLTSFWSERSASGWTPLEYPLTPNDHIFADSDVIVREDEPSTLVAFAMESDDYKGKVQRFRERVKIAEKERQSVTDANGASSGAKDLDVERVMLGKTATHMRYQFQAGSARMQCKVFYAEAFDAIRRKCGVSERFVESLSRCFKWDSKGGKTKSLFLKTLDERFVLKSLSSVETQAFLKFAPDYFDYMSKCLFHNLPSALAKMLGFYQVVIKNPVTGTDFNCFLQVMENVFYEGPSNRMFDLKGSMRNRKIQSTGEKDEVLLDENLLEYVSQSPVYVRNHSNSILASSISNDTLFFSKQNVMDYSLIVGLYDDRKELLVGIIDYIRTYTWDKKLETWIKDRGKHKATVRSPKEYRNRFRASIPRYFPLAPSCWQIFGVQRIGQTSQQLDAVTNEEEQETAEQEMAEQSQTETAGEMDLD